MILTNRLLISEIFLMKIRILMLKVNFFIQYPRKFKEEYLIGGAIQLKAFLSLANRFKVKIHPFVMVCVI